MKRLRPHVLAALLLLSSLSPAVSAADSTSSARIEGLATTGSEALAHARVELLAVDALARPAAQAVATTRTRRDGSFAFEAPEPGLWAMRVSVAEHLAQEVVFEVLDGDVHLDPVELPPAGVVEVRLRDRDQRPIEGSVAWPAASLTAPTPLARWRSSPTVSPTDGRGSARLWLAVADAATEGPALQVRAAGFAARLVTPTSPVLTVELSAVPTVELRVLDGAGRPLPGTRIFDAQGPLPLAETNAHGWARASFSAHSEGRLLLETAQGRVGAGVLSPPEIGPGDGTENEPWIVVFTPSHRLSGRVVETTSGRPLPGALVWSHPLLPGAVVRSAKDGSFQLSLAGGLPRSLLAAVAGHRAARVELGTGQGEGRGTAQEIEIALAALRRGVGWVVDAENQPVEAARVRLSGSQSGHHDLELGPFPTRADGRFEVADPPPGLYDLTVEAAGHAALTVPGIEIGPGSGILDLGVVTLAPGSELSGRVLDDEGRPLQGARVLLLPSAALPWEAALAMSGSSQSRARPREAATDGAGGFSFPDLTTGSRVRLRAEKDGFVAAESRSLDLPADEPVEMVLAAPVTVSGWVVDDDGQGVRHALVTVEQTAAGASGWSSPNGDFEIRGVHPGRLAVTASAPGYRDGRIADLEVEAGADLDGVEILLQAGATLTGRVVHADGTAAAGATVEAIDRNDDPVAFTRADGAGRFELAGLSRGPHLLLAVADDGRRARRDVEVGNAAGQVVLTLESGFPVRGQVLRADGSPLPAAEVVLTQSSATGGSVETRTDPLGRFAWSSIPDGPYVLQASADGLAPSRWVAIEVDGREVADLEVVLEDGITLRGQVAGVDLADLAAVEVRASGAAGSLGARVDHQGRFVLPHLPAGDLLLSAELPGTGRRAEERLELPAGAHEIDVLLQLAAPAPGR